MPKEGCDKNCRTSCHKDVDVDIYSKARARATELKPCFVDFDVELEVRPKPHCRIRESHVRKDKEGCTVGCVFNVEVAFDFDADVICRPCRKTTCPVRIDVETEHIAKCRHEKNGSKSHSKSHSHEEKEKEKEKQKAPRY